MQNTNEERAISYNRREIGVNRESDLIAPLPQLSMPQCPQLGAQSETGTNKAASGRRTAPKVSLPFSDARLLNSCHLQVLISA